MTSPGQYGSHQYQSPETRALASIKAESYDKDQAKTLIKLKNDVGYMAAYMRKMQKSIDQANENFIQQIQSFIADFIVLLGGGSLTTIDFGDLRYVIQAIGALLGFQTVAGIPIPINLFTAAWNFFGIYIAPTAQFADVINELIDAGFAIIIDALGDIPVLGNSIQQLAAWLMEIRDALWPLIDTVFLLIDTLSGQPGTEAGDVMTGLFDQIINILMTTPEVLTEVTTGLVDLLVETPEILLSLLNGLIALLIEAPDLLVDLVNKLIEVLLTLPDLLETLLTGLIELLLTVPNLLGALLESLINLIVVLPEILVTLLLGLVELLVNSPEILLDLMMALIGLLIITPEILLDLAFALIESGAGLLGVGSPLNALNLFNLVPTDLLAQIPFSNIGAASTNLVADPDFLDPAPIEGWIHDLTGGFDGTGSRTATADGTTKELLGNLIPVSAGQIMPMSAKASWASLAGTGNPIQLAVTGYTDVGASIQQVIASHNTIPATTDWLLFSGIFEVPDNVVSIRPRLVVGAGATAGTVSFSKITATKTQSIFQNLIAGTDPGTFLPDDIGNLFTGIISNSLNILDRVHVNDFDDLLGALGGAPSEIEDRMNSFLDSLSPLNANNIIEGNIADSLVPGLGSINDNLVTRLLNISGSGFGHTDAANALRHSSFVDMDTSARLAQLELILTGGIADGDDFERVSNTNTGTGWLHSQSGSGKWATPNGHDASWIKSGNGDCDFLEIRNTGAIRTTTDLQYVASVMASKAETDLFGNCGGNSVWLRISDDTTSIANVTGIRCYYDAVGGLSIDRYISGVRTTLISLPAGTLTPPGPGSSVWGEAGTPGVARYFRTGIGTSTLLSITEVGTASGVGAAFRRWGHGGHAEGLVLTQAAPGSVHQITCKDQLT